MVGLTRLSCFGRRPRLAWLRSSSSTIATAWLQGELITANGRPADRFDHIVLEQGEIESSRNTEVLCEVKSQELQRCPDSVGHRRRCQRSKKVTSWSNLTRPTIEAELREAKIQVITAATANVTSAEALVEQARIAREEYLEGVFKTEESAILSEIAIAEQELRKAQLALESSERLVAKGLVKELQLDADQVSPSSMPRPKSSRQKHGCDVLQNLTKRKMLVQFDSDIEAAEAQLSAYQSNLVEEEQELADTETQLSQLRHRGPGGWYRGSRQPLQQSRWQCRICGRSGCAVRERQAIIRLPDPVRCRSNARSMNHGSR